MASRMIAIPRSLINRLLAGDSPQQLAAGFTLGMIIGLVPKGNLIAVSLCVLLFSLRVNKGLAIVAAVLFSFLSPLADSFSHKLGLIVLCADSMQAKYASVFQLPLGPWIGFDNTAATGSLLVGLYLAYPVYWSVRTCGAWIKPAATSPAGVTP
jgi:uncharacterized protein (TIGR03546 family)